MAKKRSYRKNKNVEAMQEAYWQERFRELKAYKREHGDCNVSSVWPEDQTLSNWVRLQRSRYGEGRLAKERVEKLAHLGFAWSLQEFKWQVKFEALKHFKANHGHCRVPSGYREDPSLGKWVANQRQAREAGKLSLEREKKLHRLGFCWDPLTAVWEECYVKLRAFYRRHGHCQVPSNRRRFSKLLSWISIQRASFRKGVMPKERIEQLEALGFVWDAYEERWQNKVDALKAFKRRYGHTRVPVHYPEDPSLGPWVHNIRHQKRRRNVKRARVIELDRLGFKWD